MKLDRSQSYGEIFGGTGGARYTQNGRYFNHAGDECRGDGSSLTDKPAKSAAEQIVESAIADAVAVAGKPKTTRKRAASKRATKPEAPVTESDPKPADPTDDQLAAQLKG